MISIMIDFNLEDWIPEIKYTFDVLLSTLGYEYRFIETIKELKPHDLFICYAINEPTEEEIVYLANNRVMFFFKCDPDLLNIRAMKSKFISDITQELTFNGKIPILCPRPLEDPVIRLNIDEFYFGKFNFDIIGNLFFSLIAYQERKERKKDDVGRTSDEHYIFKNYKKTPYINKLINFIDTFLKDGINSRAKVFCLKKELWPSGEKKAVAINILIDSLMKWNGLEFFLETMKDLLLFINLPKSIPSLGKKIKYVVTNDEPYWNFEQISYILKNKKFKSTFFIGVDDSEKNEFRYNLDDKALIDELKKLVANGNEIALIASRSSNVRDNFKKQIVKLEKYLKTRVIGSQQNKLVFTHDQTPKAINKADTLYDSTWSFANENGFKYGLSFPFKVFNLSERRASKFFEIPLNYFDDNLVFDKNSHLNFDDAKRDVKTLSREIYEENGLMNYQLSISNFFEIEYLPQLFEYIIGLEKGPSIFKATLSDIAKWWNLRNSIEIVESDSGFSVSFPEYTQAFTLTLHGDFLIKPISNHKFGYIKGKTIYFQGIPENTSIEFGVQRFDETNEEEEVEDSDINELS